MSAENTPSISFETAALEGCPGDELDFAFTISDVGADVVPHLISQPQAALADSPSRTRVADRTDETIRGHFHYTIPRDPAPDSGTYQLRLEDPDLGLSATVEVTVPGVSLASPSFDWKDGKLTASTEVKSCSPLKPEAKFTLSCSDGALVLTADIKAAIELPGGSSVELEFPQYQQQLGSCELNFYEDGPAAQPTASHPIEPNQLQRFPPPSPQPGPPKPRPWKIPLAVAGALVGAIVVVVALLPGDDGGGSGPFPTATAAGLTPTNTVTSPVRRDIPISVIGAGGIAVASEDGDRAVLVDGDTFTAEDGAQLLIEAIPARGWRFHSWRGLDSTDLRITIPATEDLALGAVFVEPSLSDLTCTDEDAGEIVVECTAEALNFGPDALWAWSAPQSDSREQPNPTTFVAVFVGEGPLPWVFDVRLDVCNSLGTVCLGSDFELTLEGTPDLVVVPNEFDPAHAGVELVGSSEGCTTLFAIQNIGNAAAASSTVLVSIFSADTTFDGSATVPVLSPDETAFVEVFVPTSGFCQHNSDPAGEIEIDAREAVDESDETNNTLGWFLIG
ncbi:MAG: hypothetical protein HOH95_05305 [Dehalococcoidia bacterium]|jgi:hypothetical protein|nr:hypothetical protein [Dehalococcoidia bacterium]